VVLRHGEAPEWLLLLLEGEIEFYWANSSHAIYVFGAGAVLGALPHSRMTHYNGLGRATLSLRMWGIHKRDFAAMLKAIPVLETKLIAIMVDRVREITRLDLREEKLMSLGKLSAGLAHELNNPASAAHRAASQFAEALQSLEGHAMGLAGQLEAAKLDELRVRVGALQPTTLSPLQRSDLEMALADWLELRGIPQPWECAPTLAEAGLDPDWLEALHLPQASWPAAIGWLEAHLRTHALAQDIELSTERVSRLVNAVKSYTYLDQSPKQEVDVQRGLEDTLTLFSHRLAGIRLERDYDPRLPCIPAYGGELNQVWTNLIENALDAMAGSGVLRLRTVREQETALVEVGDSGPGIPAAIRERIFDPFFTTKAVGAGMGLGLDTVRRIVQRHRGSVRFESQPGDTRFQVRLLLREPQ
jgi:signal transduction histidine kinase